MYRRLMLLALLTLAGCTPPPAPPSGGSIAHFEVRDSIAGNGAQAQAGDIVTVHYTGWLYDEKAPQQHGQKFDSSVDRGEPFKFPLGAGTVIKGWDEGVAGMKVGGKRTLLIPADYGYGNRGAGGIIPPGASLVFEVELLAIQAH